MRKIPPDASGTNLSAGIDVLLARVMEKSVTFLRLDGPCRTRCEIDTETAACSGGIFVLATINVFLDRANVSKRGSLIPEKLKNDAIVEAIFEIRFRTTTQPEFLVVRLADYELWRSFTQARLPAYGIPENIRQADANFTFQPTFELSEPTKQRAIRIGPNVLSYHLREPYVGWAKFKQELQGATRKLFDSADHVVVSRLGLRYVNSLSSKLHGIDSIADLDLSLSVAGAQLSAKVNLNFFAASRDLSEGAVRIASPEFVLPQVPNDGSVVVDIDTFTKVAFEATEYEPVVDWLEHAHTAEKEEFFCLLTDATIARLKES